jgi:hypothetical protein
MELAKNLTLVAHFIGLAMILGPFFVNMRAHSNFGFGWVLTGALLQLVSGAYLTVSAEIGLANDPEESVNHIKIGVKLILALVIVVVAVIARSRVRKIPPVYSRRKVLPLLHISGALALTNVALAVLWH